MAAFLRSFRPRSTGLRLWLALSFGALAIALVAVLAWRVERVATDKLQEDIGLRLQTRAQALAGRLDRGLYERLNDMRALTLMPMLDDPAANEDALRDLFDLTRGDRAQTQTALAAEGIDTAPHPLADTALEVLSGARKIQTSAPYLEGMVELQDASSQAVVQALPLAEGMRVLDLCAGGGGKTLAMAARAKVRLWAHDINAARMRDLPARAARAAAARYRQALDADPLHLPAWINLGNVRMAVRDYDGAEAALTLQFRDGTLAAVPAGHAPTAPPPPAVPPRKRAAPSSATQDDLFS